MALKPCPECGREVSTAASACPSCGKPLPKRLLDRNVGCVGGCLILLAIVVIGSIFSGSRPSPVARPPSPSRLEAPTRPSVAADTRAYRTDALRKRMASFTAATPSEEVVIACDEWNYLGGVPVAHNETCWKAYLSEARAAGKQNNFDRANAMVDRAESLGASRKAAADVRTKFAGQQLRIQRESRAIAASDLTRTFATSLIKGWDLKATARGPSCEVLHIEGYTNLAPTMMDALYRGDLIYAKVVPGGVSSFAASSHFDRVVFTNTDGTVMTGGSPEFESRSQVLRLKRCR